VPGGQQILPQHLGLPFVILGDQHVCTHDRHYRSAWPAAPES
jgi:hypothetical protein